MRDVKAVDPGNLLETQEYTDLDLSIKKIFEELDSEVACERRLFSCV